MTSELKVTNSLLDIIGRTPVLRMIPFEKEGVRLYAKLEGFNPTGSVSSGDTIRNYFRF
jgi:cysteine synthase